MARESLLVIIEKYDGFVNYIYPVVQNMERKIKRYTKNGEHEKLFMFLASWYGHVKTADSHNLKSTIGRIING